MTTSISIRRLTSAEIPEMRAMLAVLGKAFDEIEAFTEKPPSASYLARLLDRDTFIALAAFDAGNVVGGLAAYVLEKFEQERGEIYIYDLAVAEESEGAGSRLASSRRSGTSLPGWGRTSFSSRRTTATTLPSPCTRSWAPGKM